MSLPPTSRRWILAAPAREAVTASTFKLETRPTPSAADLKDGQLLVKVVAFSNDPAQRLWIDDRYDPKRMYAPAVKVGEVVRAIAICQVLASKSSTWTEGQVVLAWAGWAECMILDESAIQSAAVQAEGLPELISLGLLGLVGMTAYVGAIKECDLKPEHTVVVSAAAGAIGSIFVQIAKKVIGCKRVIGIAGGKEKCDWVKSLGADECIDHKDAAFADNLAAALPEYADVFFDNVGGQIFDGMLKLVKTGGYISACGATSRYDDTSVTLKNFAEITLNRLTVKGFLIIDHFGTFPKAGADLVQWLQEGKLDAHGTQTVISAKIDEVPAVWGKLFEGSTHKGKLLTKLV